MTVCPARGHCPQLECVQAPTRVVGAVGWVPFPRCSHCSASREGFIRKRGPARPQHSLQLTATCYPAGTPRGCRSGFSALRCPARWPQRPLFPVRRWQLAGEVSTSLTRLRSSSPLPTPQHIITPSNRDSRETLLRLKWETTALELRCAGQTGSPCLCPLGTGEV